MRDLGTGLIKNVVHLFLNLFFILSFIFFALRILPGDPVERILGDNAKPEEITKLREELHLDKSRFFQYVLYLKSVIYLDFGQSLFKRESVKNLVQQAGLKSLTVGFVAVSLSWILGSLLGLTAGFYHRHFPDKMIRVLSVVVLATPAFSLAPMLILLFSIKLQWLPVSEWGGPLHLILPVAVLTLPLATLLGRLVRGRFLEEMKSPWVLTLMAKGLTPFEVNLRIYKCIFPSILNILALQLSVVLTGTVVTETLFDINGLGMLLFESINNRDYPLIQGIIVYVIIVYFLVYLLFSKLVEWVDPRMTQTHNEKIK